MANVTVLLKPTNERADIMTMGQKVRAIAARVHVCTAARDLPERPRGP